MNTELKFEIPHIDYIQTCLTFLSPICAREMNIPLSSSQLSFNKSRCKVGMVLNRCNINSERLR